MKCFVAIAAAGLLMLSLPPAHAHSPATAPAEWRAFVDVCRLDRQPAQGAKPPPARPDGRCLDREMDGVVLPADIPAELRRRRLQGITVARVDVGPDAQAHGCRVTSSSGEPRLDRVACEMIMRRGRFRAFYAAPAQPIPSRWDYAVLWEISDQPPLPVIRPVSPQQHTQFERPRPRPWPRLRWFNDAVVTELPRIQGDFPSAAAADGIVSLDLVVTAEGGIEDCVVGVSAGDPALDSAACRVARAVGLRYPRPCHICAPMLVPLQVHWRRTGGSHIRFPLSWTAGPSIDISTVRDPADRRTAPTWRAVPTPFPLPIGRRDFRGLEDRTIANPRFVGAVSVDAAGRPTGCRTSRSTGNPGVDRTMCALILSRGRYVPQTDVFGDTVAARPIGHAIDLSGVPGLTIRPAPPSAR